MHSNGSMLKVVVEELCKSLPGFGFLPPRPPLSSNSSGHLQDF